VTPIEHGVLAPEGYGVTGGSRYQLVALDGYRGQARWTTVAAGGGFRRPTVHGDRVYVGGASGSVVALETRPSPDATQWPVRWTYDAGVAVGAVTPGANETLVVDQSAHVHRVTDGERRGGRLRLVDDGGDERCGFVPNRRHVRAATVEESRLVVSSRWWLRSVEPDGD
jgi:hypothetical protein